MARSAALRRVRSQSASVRPRRASARTGCAALLNKGLMLWEMAISLLTDVLQLGRKLHGILSAIRATLRRFNRGLGKRSIMRFTKILVLVVLGALVIVPAALALRFTDDSYIFPVGETGKAYSKQLDGTGGCGPALPYQYKIR